MKQFPQPPAVDFECEKSFWGKMTKLQDEISGSVVKETRNDAGKGRGYNYASEADVYPKIIEATLKHEMNVVLAAAKTLLRGALILLGKRNYGTAGKASAKLKR